MPFVAGVGPLAGDPDPERRFASRARKRSGRNFWSRRGFDRNIAARVERLARAGAVIEGIAVAGERPACQPPPY